MRTFLILITIAAALYLLHRAALWAEARGWIYYLRRKPDPTSLASALLELQQLAEPQTRHVIELKQEDRAEHADAAGPDKAGRPRNRR